MEKSSRANGVDFDTIYREVIQKRFGEIKDERGENSSYRLRDALSSGFAIYSLKSPSLLSFRQQSEAEKGNLRTVFGIEKIPSDNGLRKILDEVSPTELGKGFGALFTWMKQKRLLEGYRYWQDYLVVSIDGVEHFCSKQLQCPHCMKRTHRDGTSSHYHALLSAAIVCPGKSEVFVLENEPILKQDGAQKNDCEQNAAKRLFERREGTYGQEKRVYVMDALYACGPIIRQITRQPQARYIIGVTDKGHTALFRQFDQANERQAVHWKDFEAEDGKYTLGYLNQLTLNDRATDLRTNLLYCLYTPPKGEETVFSWVSNIRLTQSNVLKIMRMARSRWKIENEVFNTLKNQQYHFEHNFGHGQKHLCTNFAFLMMMAFTVDQIQQYASHCFKVLLQALKTKVKLWESLRAVFKILPVPDMKTALLHIAQMYQIKLE
ncbi:MAG: transposase [Bacteroidia bacterium]|nr:transposase [Bacteroidia bacterium]